MMLKTYPYDVSSRKAEIDNIKAAFKDINYSATTVGNDNDFAPIFITGMPRSGTTLVNKFWPATAQ